MLAIIAKRLVIINELLVCFSGKLFLIILMVCQLTRVITIVDEMKVIVIYLLNFLPTLKIK